VAPLSAGTLKAANRLKSNATLLGLVHASLFTLILGSRPKRYDAVGKHDAQTGGDVVDVKTILQDTFITHLDLQEHLF
jgi:hypothetical protein